MNEITLKDFMECIGYQITESAKYCWDCYGPNAMSFDHWNSKHGNEGLSIHVVFDTVDQTVYEMQAWDYKNGREYRWIHPNFKPLYMSEAERRGVSHGQSFDDHNFIDLEHAEDILEKASAIFRGEDYDTRVLIQLNMTEDEEILIMRAAHAADMTVNEFVAMALQEKIDELERDA
jgi:hypothetical protein